MPLFQEICPFSFNDIFFFVSSERDLPLFQAGFPNIGFFSPAIFPIKDLEILSFVAKVSRLPIRIVDNFSLTLKECVFPNIPFFSPLTPNPIFFLCFLLSFLPILDLEIFSLNSFGNFLPLFILDIFSNVSGP